MADHRPRRLLIVGGGCYGLHYLRALRRARSAGEPFHIWLLDRDPGCAAAAEGLEPGDRLVISGWDEFLLGYLDGTREELARRACDLLVPSPLAPHLFARWLAARARRSRPVEPVDPPALPELPFARLLGQGGLALSHAAWRCPTHCIEPQLCPATRQRKDWEMARSLVRYARTLRQLGLDDLVGPLVARCAAWRQGVGVVCLRDWLAAERRVAACLGSDGGTALVATASSCHGVAHLLRLGAVVEWPSVTAAAPAAVTVVAT